MIALFSVLEQRTVHYKKQIIKWFCLSVLQMHFILKNSLFVPFEKEEGR